MERLGILKGPPGIPKVCAMMPKVTPGSWESLAQEVAQGALRNVRDLVCGGLGNPAERSHVLGWIT